MKCINCDTSLHYGDKYCNSCGEKVEKGAYDKDYSKTLWGKLDKLCDWWETFTLKKFIDHWITKALILLAVLLWGVFDAYTDIANIKFLESDNYSIEYNTKDDEYYIRTNEKEVELNLYIPRYSERITITEYSGDKVVSSKEILAKNYKEKPVKVKNNKYNHVIISSVRGEKITDTVKFYVTE